MLFLVGLVNFIYSDDNNPAEKRTGLSKQERIEIVPLVKKYFESKDAVEKNKIFSQFGKYDNRLSDDDVTYFSRIIWPLTAKGPKIDGKSPAKCTHPLYAGEYLIDIPDSAKSGLQTGIFISLHDAKNQAKNASNNCDNKAFAQQDSPHLPAFESQRQ